MASSTEILLTFLILGVISTDLAEGLCRTSRPIIAGTVALPTNPEILPLSVFDNVVVGNTLYAKYQGTPPSAPIYNDFAIQFTRPTPDIVDVIFDFLFNGTCVRQERNFTQFLPGDRAEFVNASGTYAAFFSSNPSSYVWSTTCRDYTRRRRCSTENLVVTLLTRNNPPDNLNLEMVGRDLRTRTCLNMEQIPGRLNFPFIQGDNTCPGNGLEERSDLQSPF